jgi:O-antigen/teichoic acid export membrane protein
MKSLNWFKGEMIRGGIILTSSIILYNFFNYLFHIISARLLDTVNYGVLATIMSIVYIFNVPSESIQTIASRYTTKYYVKKEPGKIKSLLVKLVRGFFFISLACFGLFILLSPFISEFLKINLKVILLTGVILIAMFLIPITRGIMQGLKKFKILGANYLIEGLIKVTITGILIFLGFRVYGALLAVIISLLLTFFISFLFIKDVIKTKRINEKIKGLYLYSFPVLVSTAAIMGLLSMDLLMVRHFFSQEIAGQYAVISMSSKIIFFGTCGISKTMFPLISERHERKSDYSNLFKKSALIILLFSSVILIGYFFLPKLIITILFGSKYLPLANLLIIPSIAMTLLSITNLVVLYNLATNHENLNYLTILFVPLQVILLYFFHSNIYEFSLMLLISNLLLLFTVVLMRYHKS